MQASAKACTFFSHTNKIFRIYWFFYKGPCTYYIIKFGPNLDPHPVIKKTLKISCAEIFMSYINIFMLPPPLWGHNHCRLVSLSPQPSNVFTQYVFALLSRLPFTNWSNCPRISKVFGIFYNLTVYIQLQQKLEIGSLYFLYLVIIFAK